MASELKPTATLSDVFAAGGKVWLAEWDGHPALRVLKKARLLRHRWSNGEPDARTLRHRAVREGYTDAGGRRYYTITDGWEQCMYIVEMPAGEG